MYPAPLVYDQQIYTLLENPNKQNPLKKEMLQKKQTVKDPLSILTLQKKQTHLVTSIDSDALDPQAQYTPSHNLANRMPLRLFPVAGQQFVDSAGACSPIQGLLMLRKDADNAQEKD